MAQSKFQVEVIQFAAERAADEPSFFAHVLREYRTKCGLDRRSLAKKLGCTLDELTRLELCRRPALTRPNWQQDLYKVANYAHVDSTRILQILREVDALSVMKTAPSGLGILPEHQTGLLAAARLRKAEKRKKSTPKSEKG